MEYIFGLETFADVSSCIVSQNIGERPTGFFLECPDFSLLSESIGLDKNNRAMAATQIAW